MFFGSRSKLIAKFRGTEQIFTRYGRLSSFFSWSLHVYKGSSVENGARGRWDDLFWVYMLHILGGLCVLELDPVHILLGQYSA